MTYYRTVDNLQFEVFEVFGVYIPSIEMIQDILNERFTNEAKRQFCDISNHYCSIFKGQISIELPPDTPENKLTIERIKLDRKFMGNMEAMASITGQSFDRLAIYRYVMRWYQAVAGNFSGGNPQAIRRGKIPTDVNPRTGEIERDKLYFRYSTYQEACDCIYGFYDSIASLYWEGNLEVINLSDREDDIFRERSSLEETIRKQHTKQVSYFCKYCQRYHIFDSFKARQTCGSNECKRKFDAERKIPINRKGWVKDLSVRPKKCLNCGTTRSDLNKDRLCKVCYLV